VSWPLASFSIVALVLIAGWLAYERRRPSARMAAVVAVMVALTALGRDAFAALPDVKPITAMTLVVGYSLGPLPGFTVGALGMLVSNFMLGQGPYTPWQMAAWGLVGLLGSALGTVARRRLGRVSLAFACALCALAAKEVMNVYTWTIGASHTPAAFLLVAGQALPYDVTDTIASFLFGLAFAPELARVLARMRVRMDVVWQPVPRSNDAVAAAPPSGGAGPPIGTVGRSAGAISTLAALALSAVALLGCAHAAGSAAAGSSASSSPASAQRLPLARQLSFLTAAQNPDGGFGGARGQSSGELYTAWVAMGLAAAGRDPLSVRLGGHSPLDALRAEAGSLQGAGDLERTILALHACGVSARSLGGTGGDPVSRLLALRGRDGSFGHLVNLTAFAVLALRAAGFSSADPVVRAAARWVAAQQDADGGFGFAGRTSAGGGLSDVDDTAAALQALASAAVGSGAARSRASAYLARAQNLDGGFPQQRGEASNAQSTAWAVQGLLAARRDPARVTRGGSRSPLAYIESLIGPDGSVRYSRISAQTPVWVTAQALTALALKPLPIAPVHH
jgi:Squalene-hopene cyclase C-terminal domain/ECF-type riboflavin transporter, S component